MANKKLLLTILLIIVFLSGCIDQPGNPYLDLDLLMEDQLDFFNKEYVNLTQTDLSPYPSLKEAILKIVDPTTNVTNIFVEITYDEMSRIRTEILITPDNDTYNYIAYEESLFEIGFAVP